LKRYPKYLLFGLLLLAFFSCSTTRHIPEGQYLLNSVSLETDSSDLSKTGLMELIQQRPNNPKFGLMIYNLVNNDSTWFKRLIRKIGNPPVIFSQRLLNQTINEMTIEVKNRGFLNAQVQAVLDTTGQKISVAYHIHEGTPYRIKNYEISFPNENMNNLAKGIRIERAQSDSTRFSTEQDRRRRTNRNPFSLRNQQTILSPGTIFDMTTLDRERAHVSSRLRNNGYFLSTIDNLHFLADTALRSNEVDLTMILRDTTQTEVFTIKKIKVFSGYDFLNSENFSIVDSVTKNDITIYYDSLRFLRPKFIMDKILIRPGGLFRERSVQSTFNLFQALNSMGRVDVRFDEKNYPDTSLLDCGIYLAPGDMHSIQASLNGTNKAGDLGVAVDVNYGNQNLFNGSELFNIRLNAAYEFVNSKGDNAIGHNFYELGITPSLTFYQLHLPSFIRNYIYDRFNPQTQYSLGFNIQQRPQYTRNFFNLNWQFRWSGRNNIVTHTINLININYVSMPWISKDFQDYLNNSVDSLTRYSYANIFTAGSGYSLIYSNANSGQIRQNLYTVRFNAESSGNILNAIMSLKKTPKNGQYEIFRNPFAQYVKGDFDYSETVRLSETESFAYHAALGLAYPYGNSSILPFEKRYYAGGPNNVRGWWTRYLGPGSFSREVADNMIYHVGDINLLLSAEYRYKILDWMEPAAFVDCGNIWTIKDYSDQPGGLFKWSSFYKEMAIGTGVGLRFDFTFLIFRLDAGTRVYDPARPEGDRYVFLKGNFLSKSAIYVAIGYPF